MSDIVSSKTFMGTVEMDVFLKTKQKDLTL